MTPIERWAEALEEARDDLLHEDHRASDWSAHVVVKKIDAALAEMRAVTAYKGWASHHQPHDGDGWITFSTAGEARGQSSIPAYLLLPETDK